MFLDICSYEADFIRKANRDGEVYCISVENRILTMKQYPFVFVETIERFFKMEATKVDLDHPNLCKMLAYWKHDKRASDELRETATVSIVYDRYDCNL